MKNIRKCYKAILLFFSSLIMISCLPDTELGPDPVAGSIVRFQISNVENSVVAMLGKKINVSLPIGSVKTGLIPNIILAKGSTLLDYTPGQEMDFTNDVILKVKGTDGFIQEYLVTVEVKQPEPGFARAELLFEKRHPDLPTLTYHNYYSVATSGDYLLVGVNGRIEVYNPADMSLVKSTLAGHPGSGIHQVATDSAGRVLTITVTANGGIARFYKWNDVNSTAELINQWTVDEGGTSSQHVLGRNNISILGDLSKDAVIYTAASFTNKIFKWTIRNGSFVSAAPEKISYTLPIGTGAFPNITSSVNLLGPEESDGYTVTGYNRGGSHESTRSRIFPVSDFGGGTVPIIRSFVFDFAGAKYMAYVTYSSYVSIVNISNPDGITMNEAQRFEAGINFKPFAAPQFLWVSGQSNTNATSGFAFKQNEDGTGVLYHVFTNAGVRAYKLIPNN